MATIKVIIKNWVPNKFGQVPVIVEYEHGRNRWQYDTEFRVGQNQYETEIDKLTKLYRVVPCGEPTQEEIAAIVDFNGKLSSTQQKIRTIIADLTKRSIELKPEHIKSEFFKEDTIVTAASTNVLEWYHKYISTKKSEIGAGINSYAATLEHFKEFTKDRGLVEFDNIDRYFLNDFRSFLANLDLQGSTIHKQFKNFRIFLNWVTADEDTDIAVPTAYKKIKVKGRYGDPIGLNLDEFYELFLYDLTAFPELGRTRDIFVFGVSIGGPRDGDLRKMGTILRKYGFQINESRITYFENKTGNAHKEIDVNAFGIEILKKYNGSFPYVPSNQRINQNLKAIATKLKWNSIKLIAEYDSFGKVKATHEVPLRAIFSTKFMRKTAATIDNYIGVPTKTSMSRTGHRTFASYSRYVDVNRQSMEYANELWNKVHDSLTPQETSYMLLSNMLEEQLC